MSAALRRVKQIEGYHKGRLGWARPNANDVRLFFVLWDGRKTETISTEAGFVGLERPEMTAADLGL